MPGHFTLMVPGGEPADQAKVVSPFDGRLIATIDRGGRAAVDLALKNAYALFQNQESWLPIARRIEVLERAAVLIADRRDQFARGAAEEGGKPLADSRVEVDRAIDGLKLCVHHLRTNHTRSVPMDQNAASSNRVTMAFHEPIGVVVAFSAFNHPLNLIVHQIGPAIATGCPVIVKPATDTPLSCMRLVAVLREAGLPAESCQALLTADRNVSYGLMSDPRVGLFSFIGSPAVGWKLRSQLAPGTRCLLEHGGAAPVIVTDDADIEDAVPRLVKGAFYHAGQVCVSTQRIYADRSISDALCQRLVDSADALVVGDPLMQTTDVGPLIRNAEVERVGSWVDEAKSGGGTVLCGGIALSESCYAPTILIDPPADSRVTTQEVFGPVVSVCPYDTIDDALSRANRSRYAFQAALFSNNVNTVLYASRRLNASTVMVNDHTAFRVDWMPFAGLGESGLGEGGIPQTMRDMQVQKTVIMRSSTAGNS
jgi:acyl-CoA reductase-like NAD-dependent aldehyde dehydrogenase